MTETSTALTIIDEVREELAPMKAHLGAVLPSHISPDKFMQVCITALENNPDLLRADRQSFKVACMNAANDGLLPDKREGAFVIFNTEVEIRKPGSHAVEKKKVPLVQWMPMITGILKKAYQTGKVQSISVEIVYENDVYRRAAGDNAEIVHEPLDFGDRGKVRGGYAIIRMAGGGEPHREVVSLADIEKVRNVSRSKDRGPWVTFWDEMAKKTILRRALKRVPLSAEVDQVLARDDVFYDLGAESRSLIGHTPSGAALSTKAMLTGRRAPRPKEITDGSMQDSSARQEAALPESVLGEGAGQGAASETQGDGAPHEAGEADQRGLIATVTLISNAADISALLEAVQAAQALAQSSDEHAWINETAKARKDVLAPPADDGEAVVLRAIISSAIGERAYEDPDLWQADLLAKMDTLAGDPAVVFWRKNLEFVIEAGEGGYDEHAQRLLDIAEKRGWPTEMPNG